jgi:hypothetical protein
MKHNSVAELISHTAARIRRGPDRRNPAHRGATGMRRSISAIFILLSIVTAFVAFGVPVNTSWTYQGQLQRSGGAYNGTCNFQFILWDAASAGSQQGSTQAVNSVNVVNGLFTVTLDFEDAFDGGARWLGTSVQCSGDGGFTQLDPRQPLTAAPYALSLRPGTSIHGEGNLISALNVANSAGIGIVGTGTTGVWGQSQSGNAIYGQNDSGVGFAGRFIGPVSAETAITGDDSRPAIEGTGEEGVRGSSNSPSGRGVSGVAQGVNSESVSGLNTTGKAISGTCTGSGTAVYGVNVGTGFAGRFDGPVHVQGALTKASGSFKIDHPLDPANKFLSHSFVESPDMKNIYDGNVTTDATGGAIVSLPDYFETLNRDFRYQLTVLDQFAQAIVSREIAQNTFEIRTDKPGVKVSWQVTGIRQDAYAREHPIVVEEAKRAEEQGMYLYPAGFGAGEEKRLGGSSRPALAQDAQGPSGTSLSDQATSK